MSQLDRMAGCSASELTDVLDVSERVGLNGIKFQTRALRAQGERASPVGYLAENE